MKKETLDEIRNLIVCGKKVEILKTFVVLYVGWEMDSIGWIVKFQDGKKGIVLTSHGVPYIANRKELEEKINDYINAIDETKKALKLLD